MISESHEAAREYHKLGLPITLCGAGSKRPFPEGWPSKRWTVREIDREFLASGNLNVGTRLGPGAKLIDIETDSSDGEAALAELFDGDPPVTPTFKRNADLVDFV